MTHALSAGSIRKHFESDVARRDAYLLQPPERPAGNTGRVEPGAPRASGIVPIERARERPPRLMIADHHPAFPARPSPDARGRRLRRRRGGRDGRAGGGGGRSPRRTPASSPSTSPAGVSSPRARSARALLARPW